MVSERPVIGKYILDSLSIGMYNHPLMLIREYIQNSTDAIDEYIRTNRPSRYEPKIEININGSTRVMKIHDNGSGIPVKRAWNILHDLGNSNKKLNENRGFRGIGRLGGLGYCDQMIFATKYENEDDYTISIWDCSKLRQLIRLENHYDSQDILSAIINFEQIKYDGDRRDHFFDVSMIGLSGSRDILLNVPLIKCYVSEVAPVPFNKKFFSFADKIDKEIRTKIPYYETYKIVINGEPVFKPYADKLPLRGGHKDYINDIEYYELSTDDRPLAFGWIGKTQLLGTLSSQSHAEGIRVRKDNILVGDKNLLSEFFRESRFNNYLVGEIYVIDGNLIPNSRRDDFEDNNYKDDFYESFIKNIGLPISKKIRHISIERGKDRDQNKDHRTIEQAKQILTEGYLSEYHKLAILKKLMSLKKNDDFKNENVDELILGIDNSKHHLDTKSANGNKKHRGLLKPIFEILYKEHEDKDKAIKIIKKILDIWT